MDWYKGQLNCCRECSHPTRETLRLEYEAGLLKAAALAKLTAEERKVLGLDKP